MLQARLWLEDFSSGPSPDEGSYKSMLFSLDLNHIRLMWIDVYQAVSSTQSWFLVGMSACSSPF